ncbi:MAG: hypothetical protein AAFN41_01070 [Planctomycetota bacterium]
MTDAHNNRGAVLFRTLVRDADRRLLWAAVLIGVLAPISAILAVIDGRVLDGSNIWFKPLKFQVSTAVFLATLAVAVPLASAGFRRCIIGRITVWTAISTAVFEIVYISLRAAIGLRSHYAFDDGFGSFMYGAMGIAAVLLSLTPIAVGIAAMATRRDDGQLRIVRLGFAMGTIVTLAGASGVGIMLGSEPAHYPVDAADASSRLPVAMWSTERGDLRIAHFVGLHAMQGMFIAGLLLSGLPRWLAGVLLITLAHAWLAGVVVLAALALDGRSPLPAI